MRTQGTIHTGLPVTYTRLAYPGNDPENGPAERTLFSYYQVDGQTVARVKHENPYRWEDDMTDEEGVDITTYSVNNRVLAADKAIARTNFNDRLAAFKQAARELRDAWEQAEANGFECVPNYGDHIVLPDFDTFVAGIEQWEALK